MTDDPLRHRGLKTVVDTTDTAEWDLQGYQVSDATLRRMARRIAQVTFSPEDRVVGDIRVREMYDFDVMFAVTREDSHLVATICGVRPPTPEDPTEAVLQKLGSLAMLRGATGM